MCLGNISKYFTIDNINKTGLTGNVQVFSVDTNDVLDIDRYLMKKAYYEVMFTFIKKMFFGLVSACTIGGFRDLIASDLKELIKCISLNNQRCKTRPAIIDLLIVLTRAVEVVTLLMILMLEFMFQVKKKI